MPFAVPIILRNSRIPQNREAGCNIKEQMQNLPFSEQIRGYDEPRLSTFVKSIRRKRGLQKFAILEQLEHNEM